MAELSPTSPEFHTIDRASRGLAQHYVTRVLSLLPALVAACAGTLLLSFAIWSAISFVDRELNHSLAADMPLGTRLVTLAASAGLSVLCFWVAQRLVLRERKIVLFLRLFRREDALATVSRAAMGGLGFGFRVVTLDSGPAGGRHRGDGDRRVEVADGRDLEEAVRTVGRMSGRLLGPNRLLVSVTGPDWRPVVVRLAQEAGVVLIDVSEPSASLQWELDVVGARVRPRWLLVGEEGAMRRLTTADGEPDPAVRDLVRALRGEVVLTYRVGEDEERFRRALRMRYELTKARTPRVAIRPPVSADPVTSPPPGPGPPDLGRGNDAFADNWWPGGDLGLPPTGPGSLASVGERVGARAIDVLVLVGLFVAVVGAEAGVRALADLEPSSDDVLANAVTGLVLGLVVTFDPLTTWLFGATPGKRAMDLDVVSEQRLRSASAAVLAMRYLVLLALWSCCCFVTGVLDTTAATQDRRNRMWHDRVAATVVLRAGRRRGRDSGATGATG